MSKCVPSKGLSFSRNMMFMNLSQMDQKTLLPTEEWDRVETTGPLRLERMCSLPGVRAREETPTIR